MARSIIVSNLGIGASLAGIGLASFGATLIVQLLMSPFISYLNSGWESSPI